MSEKEKKKQDITSKGHHPPKSPQDSGEGTILHKAEYYYSGSLPMASEFERYEQVLPGTADRLLTLVEKREEHNRKVQRREQLLFHGGHNFSKVIVLVVSLFALWLGADLIRDGHSAIGIGMIITCLVTFAGILIWGKFKSEDE